MEGQILKSKIVGDENNLVHQTMGGSSEKKRRLQRPKKPLGSYFVFMKDMKAKGTGMTREEATSYWNEMPADEKSKYVNESLILKKEYLKQLKAFEEQHPEDPNEGDEDDNAEVGSYKMESRLIPFARVKSILKCDEENSGKIRRDVITLIQHATEKFASNLISESIQDLRKKGKRTLNRRHIIGSLLQNFKYDFLLDACIFEEDEIKEAESDKRNFDGPQSGKRSAKKRQDRSSNNQLISDVIGNGKMAVERDSEIKPDKSIQEFNPVEEGIIEVKPKEVKPKGSGGGLLNFFSKKT